MNRRASIILIAILMVMAVIGLRGLKDRRVDTNIRGSETASKIRQVNRLSDDDPEGRGPSPRNRGNPVSGLSQGAKPPPPKEYSSTVKVEIKAGESLVMGGYKLPDGLHEFTMVIPNLVTMEDGTKMIQLHSWLLSVTPEFVSESGMESLITSNPATNQHAEAWSKADTQSTLSDAIFSTGGNVMSYPNIITKPGQTAAISFGGNGQARYSIETKVVINEDGGFYMESRATRTTD